MKIVEAHKAISREVTADDLRRVMRANIEMRELFGDNTCALAHPQVEDKDPLRFFVLGWPYFGTKDKLILNPRIIRESGYAIDSVEGCQTWPTRPHVTKQRKRIITAEYQTIDGLELSAPIQVRLTGFPAFVFQHEYDHLEGRYCYDTE